MALETTTITGWAPEATVETDPIGTVSSDYFKFGAITSPFDLPGTSQIVNQTFQGNRDPSSTTVEKSEVDPAVVFWPTSGIMFYYFFGSVAHAGGGDPNNVHTVTGLNSGNLPTLTYRWEGRGGTVNRFKSVVGTRCESLSILFSAQAQAPAPLTMTMGMAAIKQQTASLNQAHNGTTHIRSRSDLYVRDNNFVFTWNSEDFAPELQTFQWTGLNIFNKTPVENQTEREYILEGARIQTVMFDILRGDNYNIFDDQEAGTKRSLQFKIYNTASRYIQMDLSNVMLKKDEKNAYKLPDEQYTERFQGVVETASIPILDGLNDADYA